MATYFSLGMEASLESRQKIAPHVAPEGKRQEECFRDRSKYRTFVAQLALFYGSDPQEFKTVKSRISFTASCLRGLAFEWFELSID